MQRILIVGATSAIAEATAREFAARGDALFLAGRNAPLLQTIADDLRLRGASIAGTVVIDVRELERLPALIASGVESLGGLDQALIAHGTLSDQNACEDSIEALREEFTVNALSVMVLCLALARVFAARGAGVLAVISSVAGDRGRHSNYAYGAAKASVTAFLSGLGQQLYARGVRVLTIKPGFVDTPMTAAFPKGALWAKPARVAHDIRRAMDRGSVMIYTPWFWRAIMFIVRSVPETLFRRRRG
ncbi:MAG TPA: SDR family oxidoreductase [Steroidobacteraceae bacterium]|nr:SDR family oxidoreductase [Steroidobacteraceae bacterium]